MRNQIDLSREWVCKDLENGVEYIFPAPKGAGYRPDGFDYINEAAVDVMRWYGFLLRLNTKKPDIMVLVTAKFAGGKSISTSLSFAREGEHCTFLALKDFNVERAKSNLWRELVSVQIVGESAIEFFPRELCKVAPLDKQKEKALVIAEAKLLRGINLAIEAKVLGKAGGVGENVRYKVTVHNCRDFEQKILVSQVIEGWESMYAEIMPSGFVLAPFSSREVVISVQIHGDMPAGAREKTVVRFVPEGNSNAAEQISLVTLSRLNHPYIYHTKEKWQEVAKNIRTVPAFLPGFEKYKRDADAWTVPPLVPFGERDYCCDTSEENFIMACAYLYSITGERKYAEKIALFFQNFTDKNTGYPARKKGCSQSYVQEGHFFQHLALAYDMVYDAGVFSDLARERIEECFRIYMRILDKHICSGHISNWTLSELTGAIYCAMVLQDFERMDRFLFGPCGSIEQLSHGVMSDGWWYECSVGYNIWVSSMFLHTAHALLPFGINLIHAYFPLSYGKEIDSINRGEKREIRHGMYNEKWGGVQKNFICIKDLFDAIIPFLDERGVLFGINDSDEKKIESVHFGSTYDLAYTHYKDEAYLPVIRCFDMPDPIFGHAWMYENTGEDNGERKAEVCAIRKFKSAYADNIGIAMLRSQTPDRKPSEQIQAVLRYGCHGYAHGHFDRTELLSVMRYGRSFFNPEHLWWGYGHFMYKFYVQNSNTKNMVVVDGKMQIPADAKRILFYEGEFQAVGVRTKSRWGFPPFGGMIYHPGESLKERCILNACDLPSYDAAPYGEITKFTEPVEQTRVMVVLDDCIVLFDCLRGEGEHRYESLMQIKGLPALSAVDGEIKFDCHTGKKSDNPRSDEQFITDCYWYEAEGETVAKFVTHFGEGADLRGTRGKYNEPGDLCMDIYTAWPKKTRQCIGLAAEDLGRKFPYDLTIWVDGVRACHFSANAWLLGARKLWITLKPGAKNLKLEIFAKPLYTEQHYPYPSISCLFLGGAFLELADGTKIPLIRRIKKQENIDPLFGVGKDDEGGRVLIEGEEYPDAIPISPLDHELSGSLEFDLEDLHALHLTGVIGVDNFPGQEEQRRRTYGVAQWAVCGRFVTVIEPHEGRAEVSSVSGISENEVEISYNDGRRQRVLVEGIEKTPVVRLDTNRKK